MARKFSNADLYESVNQYIIELLKKQLDCWECPWVSVDSEGHAAYNGVGKNVYRGINQILLSHTRLENDYPKNSWMTFKQAKNLGGSVMKGQSSSPVIFWKFVFKDKDGNTLRDPSLTTLSYDELKARNIKRIALARYFNVFNVAQIKGLATEYYQCEKRTELSEPEKDLRTENLIAATGAKVRFEPSNYAFYRQTEDCIVLPERQQFKDATGLYHTALHEISHWTGHSNRLNRTFGKRVGTPEYAFEELVAELSASYLTTHLGFETKMTQNATYIKGWLRVLQDDPKYIFRAASLAQKAADYILAFDSPKEDP